MEILEEFDFDSRPSRSRYVAAMTALVEDNVRAVKLTRGQDFDADVQLASVQGAISTLARERFGVRVVTRRVGDDELVVGINPNQTVRRRRKSSEPRERASSASA